MNHLSKSISFITLLVVFLCSSQLYSQSEQEKINTLIEQKREFNKKNKNSVVYKIQLYNGFESQAYKIKYRFEGLFPEYKTSVIYKTPEWKTQVGNFKTRLEADRAVNYIKEKFNGVLFVFEDKI